MKFKELVMGSSPVPVDDSLTRVCPKCRAPIEEKCRWLPNISHAERIKRR